jgi:hypothetical protein
MDLGSVVYKLRQKQQKLQKLQIAGRWRTLINGALGFQKRSRSEIRWTRLMMKASAQGKCSIDALQHLSIKRITAKLRDH